MGFFIGIGSMGITSMGISVIAKVLFIGLISSVFCRPLAASQAPQLEIIQDAKGAKLQLGGVDFFIKGVNWDYIPVGHNYRYPFWSQSDAFIQKVLDQEMSLIRDGGINTLRQYPGIPPRWVDYIYQNYGIYTVINPTIGRYGVEVQGQWQAQTDYSDPATRKQIIKQTIAEVQPYLDSPGVLLWLIGNENNYGLHWSSFEIENLPQGEQDSTRARHLYSLFEEATRAIKVIDSKRLVALANGDLQYLDIIATENPSIDIFASNVYRGVSAGDLYQRVQQTLGKPFFYSELGADAFDAKRGREDGLNQAKILKEQWQEIYLNSYGSGVGNVLGGMTFQWSDGWWKDQQEENLDVHDRTASWANAAYPHDYIEGANNMNEEWFGICAKTPPDAQGISRSQPRAAYYVLREIYKISPYDTEPKSIKQHFAAIDPLFFKLLSQRGADTEDSGVRVHHLRLHLESIYSDGDNTSESTRPGWKKWDHLESVYIGLQGRHGAKLQADVIFNILGNVPQNRVNEIFYENRLKDIAVADLDGDQQMITQGDRTAIYQMKFHWEEDSFQLEGYYRIGHGHWGYEGDFFNFYQEAYDLPAIDRYQANAPIGMVFTGKQNMDGWKLALGPELYWGANPTAILKYYKPGQRWDWSLLYQYDLDQKTPDRLGGIVPEPKSQKASVNLAWKSSRWQLAGGLLRSGRERIGETYTRVEQVAPGSGYRGSSFQVYDQAKIQGMDSLGGKLRLSYQGSSLQFYSQLVYKGLVANSGPDPLRNLSAWSLRDSGRGNQQALFAGTSLWLGSWQIAPHILLREPLEGPLPDDPRLKNDEILDDGSFSPGLRLRNILDDPFAVVDNRKMRGYELTLLYDPTPETDFWRWDQEYTEDAPFAASLNLVYRDYQQSRDSQIGFTELGQAFAFNQAPPTKGLWDLHSTWMINGVQQRSLLVRAFVGSAQANNGDERLILRHGFGLRYYRHRLKLDADFRFHDFGPYDYHRDYALTFPLQSLLQASYSLRSLQTPELVTKIGLRADYRLLDQHSPRYPYLDQPEKKGDEYQLTTFIDFVM